MERLGRQLRSLVAMSMALVGGCYGDKVLSTGGSSEGGAAHGGSPSSGGEGGGGGVSPSPCDGKANGAPCEGPHACEAYACVDGLCEDTGPDEDILVASDPTPGDCLAMICGGGPDPVEGPDPTDVPDAPECFVGSCPNNTPTVTPIQTGSLCSAGVCDGTSSPGGPGTGCVQCLTWADCAGGQACLQGNCGTCTNDFDCAGNQAGDSCNGTTCRCHTASDCGQSPAGIRCNGSTCGCLQSQDCQGADWGTQCQITTCGCSTPNHCADSSLGHACVSGRCGCNTQSDCQGAQACDLLAHVCVSG